MWIYVTSIIVVSIIAKCFFKKNFWEYRYIVLLLIGGVALVATIATNYATRGSLGTRVETVWEKPVQVMVFKDTLLRDDYAYTLNRELSCSDHLVGEDSTATTRHSHYLFYYNDGDGKVGYALDNDIKYEYWSNLYIAESPVDTVAHLAKLKQKYNKRQSLWIDDASLPTLKTVKCLYLPPSEFAAIPDSLIRELPF